MDFSVAICTYNNCRLLQWTLEGLTRLDIPHGLHWELVVVDNNSTDATRQVADTYRERLPVRYVFEAAQGLSHARRRAVQETSAEWLAFVDDDCLLDVAWLRAAVTFCDAAPRAGAIGGRVRLLWQVPPTDLVRRYEISLAHQDHGDVPKQLPREGFTYLVGAGLVVRRSALAACGWLHGGSLTDRVGRSLSSGGDSEMVLRIRHAGYELWYNPAMELHHWIPKRRMNLVYLCRLMRGMGESQAYLNQLADRVPPTFRHRASAAAHGTHYFGSILLAALQEFRWHHRLSPASRVALYQSFGYLEGAVSLLWRGYEI